MKRSCDHLMHRLEAGRLGWHGLDFVAIGKSDAGWRQCLDFPGDDLAGLEGDNLVAILPFECEGKG